MFYSQSRCNTEWVTAIQAIIWGVKYSFNMSFLTHRLCHIFLSVMVTFQNGFVPKTWSSTPNQTAPPEAPQSSVANTAALLLKHLMLSKRSTSQLKSFPPLHVAHSRQLPENAQTRSKLLHADPLHSLARLHLAAQSKFKNHSAGATKGVAPPCVQARLQLHTPALCSVLYRPPLCLVN